MKMEGTDGSESDLEGRGCQNIGPPKMDPSIKLYNVVQIFRISEPLTKTKGWARDRGLNSWGVQSQYYDRALSWEI